MAGSRIEWGAWGTAARRADAAGDPARRLRAWVAGVDAGAVIDAAPPADERRPYARRVLYDDGRIEVMVARWTPGVACLPHDHGGAVGVVRVVRGDGEHVRWRVSGDRLEPDARWTLEPGAILDVDAAEVHSVVARVPMVSLHVYVGGGGAMAVYDAGKTLWVGSGAGAWTPAAADVCRVAAGAVPGGLGRPILARARR